MLRKNADEMKTQLAAANVELTSLRVKSGVLEISQRTLQQSLDTTVHSLREKSDELNLLKMEARTYQGQLTALTAEVQVQKVVSASAQKELIAASRVALAEKEHQATQRAKASATSEANLAQLRELHAAELKGALGEVAAAKTAAAVAETARAALAQQHNGVVANLREEIARCEGSSMALRTERSQLLAERDDAVATSLEGDKKIMLINESNERIESHAEALRRDLRDERQQKDAVRVECDMMLARVSRAAAKQDSSNQRLVAENRILMNRLASSENSIEASTSRARHEFERASAERTLRLKHTAAELSLKKRLDARIAAESGAGSSASATSPSASTSAAATAAALKSARAVEILRAMPPPGSFASQQTALQRSTLDATLAAAERAFTTSATTTASLPPALQGQTPSTASSPVDVRISHRGSVTITPSQQRRQQQQQQQWSSPQAVRGAGRPPIPVAAGTPPPPPLNAQGHWSNRSPNSPNNWRIAVDKKSRRQYAYNPRTLERTWDLSRAQSA
jgi:hypothetical protein